MLEMPRSVCISVLSFSYFHCILKIIWTWTRRPTW
uniref:Uncharacterized protein n=1 Tax=Rhizophora mucronata TaxID=61149 RepID=A0A2P2PWK8_RHIMU